MISKHIAIVLLMMTAVNATAPSWVATGVNVSYSSGSSTYNYFVQARNSTDVSVLITQQGHPFSASENASADYKDFWFDNTQLSGLITGDSMSDLSVTSTGQMSFAGNSWNAVNLSGTIQGAPVNYIVDQQTGLLLQEVVSPPSGPKMQLTLISYSIPSLAPPPPPQQNNTPPPSPQQNNTPPPQQNGTTEQPAQNQTAPPPAPYQPSTPPSTGNGSFWPTQPQPQQSSSLPCCPSAFILLLAGFAAARKAF